MKNKTEGKMILAQSRALELMKEKGIVPTHQVLDNEISAVYRLEIKQTSMNFQIVPQDDHRHNLAEKAIQTWKEHFIGVMSRTAAALPAHLWYQAIHQVEMQLLPLQQSNVNPKISSYTHVYGSHNYNAALFVTIGMETLVHNKPKRRGIFAEHSRKVFFIGTSFDHYRS